MLLLILSYLGGVLTILSPCILPVIPFVFARSGRSFWKSSFPLLVGIAVTFVAVATIASIGGGWAVQANAYGRYVALAVLALFGVTLLVPSIAERLTRPLVRVGSNLSNASVGRANIWQSFGLGAATGLLWAPCAGPILGLVLTGAALGGGRIWTAVLLLAYALGAATSLGLAIFAGQRMLNAMKRSLGVEEVIRRVLGVLILVGVVVIAGGFDRGLLTRLSGSSTNSLEAGLISHVRPGMMNTHVDSSGKVALDNEGQMPAVPAPNTWVNSPPLTRASLRGHVVLVDFWTYSCINCLRSLPYVKNWADQYRHAGLIVIGVHTPEFAFEKIRANVKKAVKDLGVDYPVALDNDYTVWNAFKNEYWPAHYLIDGSGTIRYHHFGEGNYDETESAIRTLLAAQGKTLPPALNVSGAGIEKAADNADVQTPETYLGDARRRNFIQRNTALKLNDWTLRGTWDADPEKVTLKSATGDLVLRFHARDAHIVLGPTVSGSKATFQVLLDGKAPGANAGVDVDAAGNGAITGQRLYGVISQHGKIIDRTLTIHFTTPGVHGYSLTFG